MANKNEIEFENKLKELKEKGIDESLIKGLRDSHISIRDERKNDLSKLIKEKENFLKEKTKFETDLTELKIKNSYTTLKGDPDKFSDFKKLIDPSKDDLENQIKEKMSEYNSSFVKDDDVTINNPINNSSKKEEPSKKEDNPLPEKKLIFN